MISIIDQTATAGRKAPGRVRMPTLRISLLWLLLALIVAWLVGGFFLPQWVASDHIDAGQVGDMFGGVNALFSGLALGGIVVAILLQREELSLQRHELELTRHELAAAAEAQRKSQEALHRQADLQVLVVELQAISALISMHSSIAEHSPAYKKEGSDARKQLVELQNRVSRISQAIETKTRSQSPP